MIIITIAMFLTQLKLLLECFRPLSVRTEYHHFFVLPTCNKLAILVCECGNFTVMRLESSLQLVVRVPYIHGAVGTRGIAVALGIEYGTGKEGLFGTLFENAFLRKFLGGIGGVPEFKLLDTDCHKSQVVRFLRPSHIEDLIAGSLSSHKLLTSLDVIDNNIVVVVHVDTGHITLAGGDRDRSDTSRSLLQLECCLGLGCLGVPHMDRGGLTYLTCDHCLTICTHIQS
jgi:hypothetical protein